MSVALYRSILTTFLASLLCLNWACAFRTEGGPSGSAPSQNETRGYRFDCAGLDLLDQSQRSGLIDPMIVRLRAQGFDVTEAMFEHNRRERIAGAVVPRRTDVIVIQCFRPLNGLVGPAGRAPNVQATITIGAGPETGYVSIEATAPSASHPTMRLADPNAGAVPRTSFEHTLGLVEGVVLSSLPGSSRREPVRCGLDL